MDNEAINRVVTGVGHRINGEVIAVGEIILSLHLVDVLLKSITPGHDCCIHSLNLHSVVMILEIFEVPWHHNNTIEAVA